jgi:2-C-methyl-D-erythritol 4-phosphate cytidylyltransferase/2-C-methyl-D-erythritol 2,4-cyclodiphosphate synthase
VNGLRVGQGFDVHRFKSGRPLKLCGLTLPGETGLEGHSDADVGLHAVTDAILGAVAQGDIGEHFPDSDPRWTEADSSVFVARAIEMAAAEGFAIVNCDLTFVGQRPRIIPYREDLRDSLAATTTEGLGFVGRSEGLAVLAMVLLAEQPRHE